MKLRLSSQVVRMSAVLLLSFVGSESAFANQSHQNIQFELNRVLRLTDNRERLLNQSERLHP